jgi:hypothetical protein
MRMNLLNSVPELFARAAIHYDAWEVVPGFVEVEVAVPAR